MALPVTEYWGTYLGYHSVSETAFTVTWSSMGMSGNIVTDSQYNIEIWQPHDGYGGQTPGTNVYRFQVSTSARSYRFGGLTPGTRYMAKLYANRQKDRAVDRITIWTSQPSYPVPGQPSLSVSVTNRSNLSISGSVGSNTDYLNVYINGTRQWRLYVKNSSSYSLTYYGSYSTRYEVEVEATNSYHTAARVSRTVTTLGPPPPDPPPAPTGLNVYASGETWASFAWNDTPRAEKYAMEIFRGNSIVSGKYDYNIYGRTKQFTGLSPGILYTAKLYGWNPGGNGTPAYLDFTLGYSRPSNFSWDITKARGRSYNLGNGRFTNLVSYDEFLSFRQRINDFRRYKRLSNYTFTNVGINTILSATLYNELHYAINAMNPPTSTPGVKSSGASDVAGLLNGLVTSLNSIK